MRPRRYDGFIGKHFARYIEQIREEADYDKFDLSSHLEGIEWTPRSGNLVVVYDSKLIIKDIYVA